MNGRFTASSRYARTETATARRADGSVVTYLRRRFVPQPYGETVATRLVAEGDRPDLAAAETLGDPLLYWQLCDTNLVMHPAELTAEIGRVIRVAVDGGEAA